MKFVLFYHSLVSDWNHGNAHFLRGIVRELKVLGHEVAVYEPAGGWSRQQLVAEHGPPAVEQFRQAFPGMESELYDLETFDVEAALDGADVVLVHEWNDPALVARLGRRRAGGGRFVLLFHDTHHRSVTEKSAIENFDLDDYDGVLAFGEVIRQRYLQKGWARQAWTWHEAADTALFHPHADVQATHDLVWIGNWGDDERSGEIRHYLMEPAAELGLGTTVHGVRYPSSAVAALRAHGIDYRGWVANHQVPAVFARHRFTVHIPRRPYVAALPGIPTIRVFEALACGIPLASAHWSDAEGLFGDCDFLLARTPGEMRTAMTALVHDTDLRDELSRRGLASINARHTCRHRVDELLGVVGTLSGGQKTEKERHVA